MAPSSLARFADLLEHLEIPSDRPLYVQASADWLRRAGYETADVMKTLTAWTAPAGTLVMPSYPFVASHREYLESGPVFDVRKTPAATGLLAEIFRRSPKAIRSLEPDFCVTALGADADVIAGAAPEECDPFGPASSYQRMLDRHALLVGLGVSLNTTSFIHVIDSRAEARYPRSAYEDRLYKATVVDASGAAREVVRKALRPEFQQLTSPSAVTDLMKPSPSAFATTELNGARFFKWDLDEWSSWCLAHAHERATEGRWPCWLERLSDA